jgi:hypothetical protein
MKTEILKNYTNRDWEKLVSDCPWGTFYHAAVNMEIIKNMTSEEIQVLACIQDGVLIGAIPFAIKQGPMGAVVNCLPFFGSYGDAVTLPNAQPNVEAVLYAQLIRECRSIAALCLTVITSPFSNADHHKNVRSYLQPDFIDERTCQVTHLPKYEGEEREEYIGRIFEIVQGRARTAYRKISKTGFELRKCKTEQEAIEFGKIHKVNILGKGGIHKEESFFRYAFRLSQKSPELADIVIMLDDNKIIAGVILFYFRDIVEYHTTCLVEKYRSIGPLNKIIIDCMADSGRRGFHYWNFGGTWKNQEGVYKFKQSFGAIDHPYYYHTVFFRDTDKIKSMSRNNLLRAYPNFFIIPFAELHS